MLSHGNLVSCATAMTQVLTFGTNDRLLSVLPLSHLYEQVLGLIGPLMVGASVVYPVSRQPAVLVRTFRDFRISILLIVPQGLQLLTSAIERKVDQAGKRARFEQLHRLARRMPAVRSVALLFRSVLGQFGGRLRLIGVGASALEVDVAERWTDMGVEVLQGYGATEMGPVVTFTRPERNVMGTVGEAIPGVEVRIADDGEILARGPGRFQGYWQNPEATAAAIDAEGWYHTGDLGAFSPEGMLTFRGRKKDMLALPDGQKVYPEDVEAVLRQDARVTDATVVGWPLGGALRVHAVLLLDDPATADDIVRTANAQLAPHQQIRGVTAWPDPDLPRTHTLKIRKPDVLARLAAMASPDRPAATDSPIAHAGPAIDVDPVTAIVASVGARRSRDDPAERPPFDRSQPRFPAAGRAARRRRGGARGVRRRRCPRARCDRRRPDRPRRGGPRGEPQARVVELAAQPDGPGHRAHDPDPADLSVHPRVLPDPGHGTGAPRRDPRAGAVHAQPLPAPGQRDHPDPPADRHALEAVGRRRGGHHLRQPGAGDPRVGHRERVPAGQREGGVRKSLELLGARLDRGFNILLYPEGKLTLGGPLQPFKAGAGLIAVEGGTPVVPVKIVIHEMSWIDRRRWPSPLRGDVELVLGDPIWFDADTDHAAATTRLEAAVGAL